MHIKAGNKFNRTAYFEIWTNEVGIGMKNNSSVNFETFGFYIPKYVFFHFHVISDWFQNIFPQQILQFLQPSNPKVKGNLKADFSKSHF